jgi:hypothetical protein
LGKVPELHGAFEDLSRRFALSRRESDAAAKLRGESLLDEMIAGKEKLEYQAPVGAREFYRTSKDNLDQLALKMAAVTRNNAEATFDRIPSHQRTLAERRRDRRRHSG